ncbi:M14 family metallopeptidase [Candidatus Palauibacter sp.]|uniref:M14 family metallopeptidase n=1 Tax=Candidatus Palauibacter sp. TaxID=3101350 RepID=UPI003B58E10B
MPPAALVPGAGSSLLGSLSAQEPPAPPDLASLFDLGTLVLDANGDSVPDFVNAALILGDDPSAVVLAAAGEVAARLGFETMAMDLPLSRAAAGDEVAIVIGRAGLAASGLGSPGIDPASLDSGEGAVAVRQEGGRTWVLVIGGDDEGLQAAARLFAGVLPHTRTLSTAKLDRVREDLTAALEDGGVTEADVRLTQARARAGQAGVGRVIAEVAVADADLGAAEEALRALAAGDEAPEAEPETEPEAEAEAGAQAEAEAEPDTEDAGEAPRNPLAYPGLESVEARLTGGPTIRIAGRAVPDRPGPIAGRPGSGGKDGMDLSNLYTSDGLLGGGLIPDRIDAMLAPGEDGVDGLPDLAGRLGLESTGLVVPLTEPASAIDRPGGRPTLVLAGVDNPLTQQLADSARIDLGALGPGEGLIQLVPEAFGSKPALVVTGADAAGAERALDQLALTFPHLAERGGDRPTVDDVERGLWDALSGHAPAGQAATGLYKLGRIAAELAERQIARAHVLMSVEKADPRLEAYLRDRAAGALGLADIGVTIDERDVQRAATVFADTLTLPSEVDRFRELFRTQVLPAAGSAGPIRVEARLSEPPEIRRQLEQDARAALIDAGASPSAVEVRVLSAFKQGYSWLEEVILPQLQGPESGRGGGGGASRDIGEIVIRFRRNDPPAEWPQQAIQTPVRWLHEIFPIDEVLARELGLGLEQVRFEETTEGPIYEVAVTDEDGAEIVRDSFEPRWVLRPYFDRFQDYEHVRVTTGWIHATADDRTLVDERIVTDPEAFWDHYQSAVLPAVYDYVMDRHDGIPTGGSADAPYFGALTVELAMSEPNYRLDIDNEIHAPMDALHEEIYFGTIEFFDVLGRNSRGQGLTFPGRILPVMRPRADGAPAELRVHFTGFATSRPAVVVAFEDAAGAADTMRLDIPKTGLERPSARLAVVRAGEAGIAHLGLRVRVDTDADVRDSLLTYASAERVDRSMVSAEQVEATLREIEALRAAGLYTAELAWAGLGSLEVWAEWTHEQDPDSRRTARLAANGTPPDLPDWRPLLPEGWSYAGERLVQWETPIPPPEGHEILAKMAETFDEATMYKVGESYLGKDIWALDLMLPTQASHWARVKATTFKPTIIYSARQHANEVSSTSHVLRHAELLLTDPAQRPRLDDVNVIIHPFTNPDGAQLAYDLYRITPDFILHAGYLGSLGIDATTGSRDDHPIYPEAPVRNRLWGRWLPDIFLNPHGYPSHQVVQLFSEYTGLVRRGRVTERNWGFNKGWFMPGFGYVDSPDMPRHRDAAFEIRDYITRGINSNRDVFEMNQRNYERYRRYGAEYDADVFRLPMTDSVLIQMPLKGSSGESRFGFDSRITIWSGTTEAPDETAYGPWMELVAKAGLSWDQALLDYLYEGEHEVNRSGSSFFGGVSLRMNRPRPPEDGSESDEDEAVTTAGPGAGPGG